MNLFPNASDNIRRQPISGTSSDTFTLTAADIKPAKPAFIKAFDLDKMKSIQWQAENEKHPVVMFYPSEKEVPHLYLAWINKDYYSAGPEPQEVVFAEALEEILSKHSDLVLQTVGQTIYLHDEYVVLGYIHRSFLPGLPDGVHRIEDLHKHPAGSEPAQNDAPQKEPVTVIPIDPPTISSTIVSQAAAQRDKDLLVFTYNVFGDADSLRRAVVLFKLLGQRQVGTPQNLEAFVGTQDFDFGKWGRCQIEFASHPNVTRILKFYGDNLQLGVYLRDTIEDRLRNDRSRDPFDDLKWT